MNIPKQSETFVLFVGDVTQEVYDAAIAYDAHAQLLLGKHINNLTASTYCTSLADCGSLENLNQVCKQSSEIYYIPPICWSDAGTKKISNQQKWTELVLHYHHQSKTVHNLPSNVPNTWLHDVRKHEKQFWTVGCSITYGVGVTKEESWPELVSAMLELPYTNLSYPASSIIWQSDQICRSDIRAGDIVFWGVTSNQRLPVILPSGKLLHLNASKISNNSYKNNNFPLELIDNTTLVYHNMLAIRRAYNYCQKIGAQLVPIGLMYDLENLYVHYDVPAFYQLIQWEINQFVDLGTDNEHPGPEQHKLFAKEFLSHYKKVYKT